MATQLKIFAVPFADVLPIEAGRFLIDTLAGPVSLKLPHRPDPGVNFKIYDRSRNAATNNITISTLFGELINGASVLVLNVNGEMADIFREDDTDNFIATLGGITLTSGGGGGGTAPSVKHYDSVLQMSQEPLYNQISMFYALGLNAPGDNQGGGWYYWNPASVAAADGNMIVMSIFTPLGRFIQVQS